MFQASCSDLLLEIDPARAEEELMAVARVAVDLGSTLLAVGERGTEREIRGLEEVAFKMIKTRYGEVVGAGLVARNESGDLRVVAVGPGCTYVELWAEEYDGYFGAWSSDDSCEDSFPLLALASLEAGITICPYDGGSTEPFIDWLEKIGAKYKLVWPPCVVVEWLPPRLAAEWKGQ